MFTEMIDIKLKKTKPDAMIPTRGTGCAAGWDLYVNSIEYDDLYVIYDSGVSIEIPEGYYAELKARSSVFKSGLILANGSGTIDSDYRGTIKGVFYTMCHIPDNLYKVGDRFAQLLIKPVITPNFIEVNTLSITERGEGGFGSSGKWIY